VESSSCSSPRREGLHSPFLVSRCAWPGPSPRAFDLPSLTGRHRAVQAAWASSHPIVRISPGLGSYCCRKAGQRDPDVLVETVHVTDAASAASGSGGGKPSASGSSRKPVGRCPSTRSPSGSPGCFAPAEARNHSSANDQARGQLISFELVGELRRLDRGTSSFCGLARRRHRRGSCDLASYEATPLGGAFGVGRQSIAGWV
jgi:hypothetical protein